VVMAIYGFHFRKIVDKYMTKLARDNGSTA